MDKETPCTAVCFMDPSTSLCLGCGRTLAEIAQWHAMDSAARLAVMNVLAKRMTDAGLSIPSPPKRKATS
ncbi:MAG: DUF1289 domain-containing protein [Pseudomonadota bacterium]